MIDGRIVTVTAIDRAAAELGWPPRTPKLMPLEVAWEWAGFPMVRVAGKPFAPQSSGNVDADVAQLVRAWRAYVAERPNDRGRWWSDIITEAHS